MTDKQPNHRAVQVTVVIGNPADGGDAVRFVCWCPDDSCDLWCPSCGAMTQEEWSGIGCSKECGWVGNCA